MILGGPPVAKALYQYGSDGETRKPGERPGLDTRLVHAVNDARLMCRFFRGSDVSKCRC